MKTQILNYQIIDETHLKVTVGHAGAASYSRSVFPTVSRFFNKMVPVLFPNNKTLWNREMIDETNLPEHGIYLKTFLFSAI